MDIYFRDSSGNRVGFVIGTDIKDNSGSRVGYIEGDSIKDNSGSRIGYIEGSSFKNNYGARVGYIEGNIIKNAYGARVGSPENSASNIEMCAAALLLFGLEAETSQAKSTRQSPPVPESGWEWFLFILSYFLKPFFELGYLNKYTATRGNYWRTLFCTYVYYLVGGMIIARSVKTTGGTVIAIIVILILSLPIIFVSIRRMHDLGKSGWWNLFPIVGFFMCGFFPGKIENNPYV
jgi:uncharacterized membrane protein YhaH (DUF805 family)